MPVYMPGDPEKKNSCLISCTIKEKFSRLNICGLPMSNLNFEILGLHFCCHLAEI